MKVKTGILFVTVLLGAAAGAYADVAVIAHKSVKVESINSRQLLDFYTGDVRTWRSGEPVVVVDLKPKSIVKSEFYQFLGKSSSRMKSIWMKNMLAGEGNPPQSFPSEDDLIRKVASTPGAIGYISVPAARRAGADITTLLVIPTSSKK